MRSSSLKISAALLQPRTLVGGRGDQFGIRAAHARDQQIAEMPDGFAAEMLQVLSFGQQAMHQREHALSRSLFDRARQLVQNFFGDDAEKFAHLRVRDIRAAIGARLFEQRKRVAQAAFGGASHHGERAGLRGQTFLRANFFAARPKFRRTTARENENAANANEWCRPDFPARSWPSRR